MKSWMFLRWLWQVFLGAITILWLSATCYLFTQSWVLGGSSLVLGLAALLAATYRIPHH